MRLASLLAISAATALPLLPARAQEAPPGGASQLGVYLDCRAHCDSDYIRTEVAFVNWLRERLAADVHVLITSEDAGAGGDAYTLAFLGQRAQAGRGDTLRYSTNPTMTSDERRRGLTRTLALGLVRFVAQTPAAATLRVAQELDIVAETPAQMTPASDPWRAWVFEFDLSGDLDGERNYRNRQLEAGFGANRTTDAWKSDVQFEISYDDERVVDIEYDSLGRVVDETAFETLRRNWSLDMLFVKSINGNWSLGFQSNLGSNTFSNQRLSVQITPAVEYNIFPYVESTRRELTMQYGMGYETFFYQDTTIFDRISETLPVHYVSLNYSVRQPWGSTSFQARHQNYLTDPSKRNSEVEGEISVRLFRGFNVNFGGEYRWIQDQINLRRGGGDPLDVLLRRRELLTGFEYNARLGFSYTFGSIFNNVVNPRF
ncbi:MAG TPA: hypothetical protein VLE53_10775 [Gemmatimonadaceae bacterium]|nr:hypothetical protein [Gemmatimonadaceae bacterium]